MMRVFKIVTLLLFVSQTVLAEEVVAPTTYKWLNSINLGGAANTGNSDSTNLNAKFSSDLEHLRWNYHLVLEGEMDTANGQRTAQNATGIGAVRYFFKPRFYGFGKGDITYDEFAAYDFVIKSAVGLGRVLFDNDKHFLSLELGPGSMHQRISGTHEFQTLFITNASLFYSHQISQTAKFSQGLSIDYSSTNTHTEAISAIKTRVSDGLALEVSFTAKNDSTIPINSKNRQKTDTTTKITIVYDF